MWALACGREKVVGDIEPAGALFVVGRSVAREGDALDQVEERLALLFRDGLVLRHCLFVEDEN